MRSSRNADVADADISEKGFGKRTAAGRIPHHVGGGKGVINLKSTDRNGPVVAALQVTEESTS